MADRIAKGIGEQLGSLGKQIVTDIAKVPGKITGLDSGGINETVGTGTSAKGQKGRSQQQKPQSAQGEVNILTELARKDEAEKQKKLAEARRLLQQFIEPQQLSPEPSVREKMELEEMEKKKKEIEEEKEKAKKALPKMAVKRPRGDLFGIKAKQFGGEAGKNVKAQ